MTKPVRAQDTREKDAPSWRVLHLDENEVHLSGPGPCRGMKTVDRIEYDKWWKETE